MDMVPAYHGPRSPDLRQARLGPGQPWPGEPLAWPGKAAVISEEETRNLETTNGTA